MVNLTYIQSTMLTGEEKQAVTDVLIACDKDFHPAISARADLTEWLPAASADQVRGRVEGYVELLMDCEFLLVFDGAVLVAFMAYRRNHVPPVLSGRGFDPESSIYVNMLAVMPAYRRRGISRHLYRTVIDSNGAPDLVRMFSLRMRGNHFGHMALLDSLGFVQAARIMGHRGVGLDTVYFILEV